MPRKDHEARIREFFTTLYRTWGRQHWWPAESRFEVIIGAFLTQNTAWTNVERALIQLRQAGVLSLEGIRQTPLSELEQLIRSAGYFRQKALRLKIFVCHLDEKYGGSLDLMFSRPTQELRAELLNLHGIGPETADSILLYAGQHPVFVVDAYTRRILDRHRILPETAKYEEIRSLFERSLTPAFARSVLLESDSIEAAVTSRPPGAHHTPSTMSKTSQSEQSEVFNEMHGLIVGVAKNYCQSRRALCGECPLAPFLDRPVRLREKDKTR